MRDPANVEEHLSGAAELAEWTKATSLATKPPVELTKELLAFVVPSGYKVEQADISGHIDARAEHPRARIGHVTVNTVESLCDYVNRHKAESTTIWAQDNGMVIAVVDDHEGNESLTDITPGWGRHRATLKLVETPAWKRWHAANRALLSQAEFAELVEESIPDIIEPDAADLLELAQNLQVTRAASFSSDMRLATGTVKFHYTEDDAASAGDMEIPQQIVLRLAPYIGLDPVEVVARFRYRLNNGQLKLGFVIDRLEELLIKVREELCDAIEVATGIKPFQGTPRS